jgi:hypothetical protein
LLLTLLLSESPESLFLPFPFPLLFPLPLPPLLVLGQEGEGPPEDMAVPAATAWRQLLLWRAPSSWGRGVERGGLSLGRRVVQLDLLKFEVIADDVEGGEWLRPLDEDLHVIELLVQAL